MNKDVFRFQEETYVEIHADRARWRLFALSGLLLILFLSLVVVIVSLKKNTELVVLEVDRSTGEAHFYSLLQINQRNQQILDSEARALAESELVKYIQRRERYIWESLEADYRYVMRRSQADIADDYNRPFIAEDLKEHPGNRYGENTVVSIQLQDVSWLDEKTVIAEFVRSEFPIGQKHNAMVSSWQAIVRFDFQTTETVTVAERWENPLRFIVTQYETSQQNL